MESVKGKAIKDINDILGGWIYSIKLNNSINLTDANIQAEDVVCGLLNRVYGWNLSNLNNLKKNYPGVDLGDFNTKTAVQVTSDRSVKKISETISKFDDNHLAESFQNLYILCLDVNAYKPRGDIKSQTINFSTDKNVITIKSLTEKINSLDEETIIDIRDYLTHCLKENGKEYKNSAIDLYDFISDQTIDVCSFCHTKMEALGLDHDLAERLWKNEIDEFVMPKFAESITYLIGGFGSGKSHFLFTMYMILRNAYVSAPDQAILPVFIQASVIDGKAGIQKWLQKNVGYSNTMRVFVLVDGLDEMAYSDAEHLIQEIRIIGYQNKSFNALIASRPLSILESEKKYPMPPVSEEKSEKLFSMINNDQKMNMHIFHGNNEKAFKEMLNKPLFVLLYALYAKDAKGISNAMDLVNLFIDKSLSKVLKRNANIKKELEEMAVLAINKELGSINQTELGNNLDIDTLLSTGFISKRKDSYIFILPIIAQWLGAMAIRDGIVKIEDIIYDTEALFAWRYSLSILFSQITFQESEDYFIKIVQAAPGMASLIIKDGICFERSGSMTRESISGRRLYKAFGCWSSLFQNIDLGITDKKGNITTLWYQQDQDYIAFSFADIYMGKDIMFTIEPKDKMHFLNYTKRRTYGQATWPWIVSLETISSRLSNCIDKKAYYLKDSIMEKEYLWKYALKMIGKGDWYSGDIYLEELDSFRSISEMHDNCYYSGINLKEYFADLDRNIGKKKTINPPYPVGDLDNYENGWIWDNYTETRMLERIIHTYKNAAELYPIFIDTFFPKLREQMSTYLLLPAKIEGKFAFDKSDKSYNGEPYLSRIAYPIQSDAQSIVDFCFGKKSDLNDEDFKNLQDADNACRMYRRESHPYISITLTKGTCFDASTTPVTDLIYDWLKNDLKKLGWL